LQRRSLLDRTQAWAKAHHRADGALLAIHFYKDVSPTDRNLLQTIATEAQLVRPTESKSVWSVEERDGAGAYLAMYTREVNAIVKRKLKYVYTDGVAGAPAGAVQVHIEKSELRFTVDAKDELLALDGGSRVQMGIPFGNAGKIAAITEIHLSNHRAGHAADAIGRLERVRREVESSAIVTHKPGDAEALAQSDDSLLKGHSTDSLLQAGVAKDSGDSLIADRLAALFRRRSEAASAAAVLLRKQGPQRRITMALGSAGSTPAIAALRDLSNDRGASPALRVDALIAFVQIQHPSAEAMRIPLPLLTDGDLGVRSAAQMTAGALARAGHAQFPADADAIDGALIAQYRKAREIPQLCEVLAALGNSVGPSATSTIREALRDARAPVRATAARALRLAKGEDIDRLLSEVILSDTDPRVRAEGIFASRFRRPLSSGLGEALARAAKADPADYVRSDAVSVLRQNLNSTPDAAETLKWIAEHDANAGVRRQAREALTPSQRGGPPN